MTRITKCWWKKSMKTYINGERWLWIGRFNIVMMSVLPKLIYRFNIIPSQILEGLFIHIDKNILMFTWRDKGTKYVKHSWNWEQLPDYKTYRVAIIIKTVWYWQWYRHIDQWSRIGNPEIAPHKCSQLIFSKAIEAFHWREDDL